MIDQRASGILLHPTSLPNPYGIGDLGPIAVDWLDWLSLNPIFLVFFFAVSGLFLLNVAGKKQVGRGWFKFIGIIIFIQFGVLLVFMTGIYNLFYFETKEVMIYPFGVVMILVDIVLVILLFLQYRHAMKHAKKTAFATRDTVLAPDLRSWFAKRLDPINSQTFLLSGLFILLLLIFTASQIHPWYFLWLFPFILGVRDRHLMFWLVAALTVFPLIFYRYAEFTHWFVWLPVK